MRSFLSALLCLFLTASLASAQVGFGGMFPGPGTPHTTGGGGGGITRTVHGGDVSGGASVTIDSTGDSLMVACATAYQGNGTGKTVTDNKGNTWTRANITFNSGVAATQVELWYSLPTTVGTGTTITYNGTTAALFVAGYSGTVTSSVLDGSATGNSTTSGSTSNQPGSITASQAGDLYVSCLAVNGFSGTLSIDSGFTITDQGLNGSVYGGGLADFIQGAAAAVNPTWTLPAAVTSDANMQAFKKL